MTRPGPLWCVAVVAAALISQGCGSDGPTAASSAGVLVQGVVLGDGASVSIAAGSQPEAASPKKLKVRVDGTSLDVDVSVNGTFELKGVPSGTFTLVFLADGVEVGRVVVSAADGSEVKIVVQVTAGALVVVEIKVDGTPSETPPAATASCAFNGGTLGQGVEIEGDVLPGGTAAAFQMNVNGRSSLPLDVNASSASFQCVGSAKTTTVDECKASVRSGAKVHVSGTLSTCTSSKVEVTASEVKVQKGWCAPDLP
jgi:hypothetical protein